MKTIRDHISGHDVTIELIGNTAVMYGNGRRIEKPVKPSDLSMARVCIAKRDLDGFGSFFES